MLNNVLMGDRLETVLLLLLLCMLPASLGEDTPCSATTWFVPSSSNTSTSGGCVCSDVARSLVHCNTDTREIHLLLTYCMTFDNSSGRTVVGSCPYFPTANYSEGYVQLPEEVVELNEFVCGEGYRKGRLCSECVEGYAPSPLSYDHECVECSLTWAARWSVFLFQQFLPVTVFYFAVLILRLEIVSQPASILFAQVYSSPELIRLIELLATRVDYLNIKIFLNYEGVLVSLYGIWNLDFFRPYLAQICLEEDLTTIDVLGLEYLVPVYVIVLTVITYVVTELHGRGFRPIVLLWKPFAVCFSKWKQQWSITESLIHTIATFILLSYNKLLVVSIRILNGSLVRDSVGTTRLVPYYAANQGYFTGSHVGFATLAVLVLLVVCIPPTLLLLYPFRAFQLCMGRCCHARLQHGLRTFVECFQGFLKNGSDGEFDCRYVAGWYFVLRIIIAIGGIDSPFSLHFGRQAIGLILFLTAIAFALLQPYKKRHLTVVDTLHFVVLSLIYWLLLNAVYLSLLDTEYHLLGVVAFLGILPLLYSVVRLAYWVLYEKKLLHVLCDCIRKLRKGPSRSESDPTTPLNPSVPTNDLDASFADRLANPELYDVLIPSRQAVLNRVKTVNEQV